MGSPGLPRRNGIKLRAFEPGIYSVLRTTLLIHQQAVHVRELSSAVLSIAARPRAHGKEILHIIYKS